MGLISSSFSVRIKLAYLNFLRGFYFINFYIKDMRFIHLFIQSTGVGIHFL